MPPQQPIKLFLAGIIQGSIVQAAIHSQDWRQPIKQLLAKHLPGCDLYCHYTQHPNSITYELPDIIATLEDGISRAAHCDILVAWLPSASMGTAIEIYEAARHGAAVLTITPLAANWVVRAYSDQIFADLPAFEAFCQDGQLDRLVRAKRGQKP